MVDLIVHLSKQPHDCLAIEVQSYLASNKTPVGYWPDDAEVTSALKGATAYNKYLRARLRMILEALEDYRRGYPDWNALSMGPIARGVGTVEHFLPQKWRANWPAIWSPDEAEMKATSRDRTLHELGNLTLVTQKLNSKVSNGSWATKVEHFQHVNDVLLTNDVIQSAPTNWDETMVTARTATLAASVLKVWPAPAGHIGLATQPAQPEAPGEVDLALLVSEGLIQPGTVLVARPAVLNGATAAVGLDGRVFVGDVGYDTPSAAGVAANSADLYRGGINGWRFWKIQGSGKSLWEVRNEYRASLGEDDRGDEVGEDVQDSEQIEAELVAAESADEVDGE
jgi:hypothetical protein